MRKLDNHFLFHYSLEHCCCICRTIATSAYHRGRGGNCCSSRLPENLTHLHSLTDLPLLCHLLYTVHQSCKPDPPTPVQITMSRRAAVCDTKNDPHLGLACKTAGYQVLATQWLSNCMTSQLGVHALCMHLV